MKTTTNLHLPGPRAHWYDIPVPIAATICVLSLILIASLAGRIKSDATHATMATPPLPILIVATAPAMIYQTAVPATPDPAVYQELEALRQRVQELEAQQAAAPAVVYVEAAPAPEVANEPAYVEQAVAPPAPVP